MWKQKSPNSTLRKYFICTLISLFYIHNMLYPAVWSLFGWNVFVCLVFFFRFHSFLHTGGLLLLPSPPARHLSIVTREFNGTTRSRSHIISYIISSTQRSLFAQRLRDVWLLSLSLSIFFLLSNETKCFLRWHENDWHGQPSPVLVSSSFFL